MGKSILNREQTRVSIFESSIVIDKSLPKYKMIENVSKENNVNLLSLPSDIGELDDIDYASLKKWYSNSDNLREFNVGISDKMRNNLSKLSFNDSRFIFEGKNNPIKDNLYNAIKSYLLKKKNYSREKKKTLKFDVINFFENVKLASKEEGLRYKNRIVDYITCIGYAEKAGQVALKEKLFENLVINKYESILYAKGYTRVLNENTLIKLAHDCPKALSLDYVSNYVRTIPVNVISKIIQANEMEVFDNYVILYYDPDNNAYQMTNKEKKAEIEKAKDPILFGVISGSNKLYYICDWIDEMYDDDITWDKVVEVLGKEIIQSNILADVIK